MKKYTAYLNEAVNPPQSFIYFNSLSNLILSGHHSFHHEHHAR